ncbi:cyanophycinase [Hymenobacter actinosclerus]|uniref:Cyanophycinase n=1 Tax=Hymenobacter actinosclerus TaxID=82805 RepID=A0A1I0FLS0_9BACT|nr:cyanophycinase [Hymenobacter actinosclerus]SET58990.1 Cyanophycinase [Hymenobacter actinosclerus]
MKTNKFLGLLLLPALLAAGCRSSIPAPVTPRPPTGPGVGPVVRPASLGLVGDTADVRPAVSGGVVLMGGGTDVDAAFRWMIARSGGGDVVVLRASGTDAYNPYIAGLGTVNSVETLLINSRELANNPAVARTIRNAEMVFIAGGDQSNYMNYWRGTLVQDALNYLAQTRLAPLGGTSAGCAILGSAYFSGENGSPTAAEALANPYAPAVTLYHDDFLRVPVLRGVLTDQHYLTRDRPGRHVAFLARAWQDWGLLAQGIAVDEKTAVCVAPDGVAQVFGRSKAYFLRPVAGRPPERVVAGQPLQWLRQQQALAVYEVSGSETGQGRVSVTDLSPAAAQGGSWQWWWVDNGQLQQAPQ